MMKLILVILFISLIPFLYSQSNKYYYIYNTPQVIFDESSDELAAESSDNTDDLGLDEEDWKAFLSLSLDKSFLQNEDMASELKLEKLDDLYYNDELVKLIDPKTRDLLANPVSSSISKIMQRQEFPLFHNEFVDEQIKYLFKKQFFASSALDRGFPYIEEMKSVFKKYNLPEEFVYLPLIESAYNNVGKSRKGATGMWQFMPGTARLMGLKMDSLIDERKDPIIACEKAAKLLILLYNKFHDWYLVLAAYNRGGGNVLKDLKKAGSNDYYDVIKKNVGPKETRNYVPRFVAAVLIAENMEQYGVKYNLENHGFKYYKLNYMTPAHLVAKHCGLDLKEFMKYNPSLTAGFIPDYDYNIRLPEKNYNILMGNLDVLKKDSSFTYLPYFIKKGDSLSVIAQRYGISVDLIVKINSIKVNTILSIGKQLFLPVRYYQIKK